MNSDKKSTLVRIGDFFFKWRNQVFPVIILAATIAFVPPMEKFGSTVADDVLDAVAIAIVTLGLVVRFATIGWAYIIRGGKDKKVYAEDLVTSGYFEMCRNPLYVGNLLIAIGICVLHGHPVVLFGGSLLFIFIYIAIVAAEEHFLTAKFGASYADYCARVNRWLPNLAKHGEATKDMAFSFKRSLFADAPTITSTALAILFVQGMEHYRNLPWSQAVDFVSFAAVLAVCCAVLLALVARWKRKSRARA